MVGIYKITSPTNRIYIGQSVDIESRFKHYKNKHCKKQPRLYNSFNKYGVNNHTFEILEKCTINELNERERYWQDVYNVLDTNLGLNCKLTKTLDYNGRHCLETKIKIGLGNKGKIRTEEYKEKMSLSRKGKCVGLEHPQYNKKLNYEWRKKLSEAKSNGKHHLLGKKLPKEWVSNIKKGKEGLGVSFDNARSTIVLDIETGVYYPSISSCARAYNIPKNTLVNYLNGSRRNKTNIRIA